ncbi:MAG: hypothetical protein IJK35_08650 [Oscillospiraceae bacterium]|nr:hypothetical protein [Oscillospiraceae bacterium]
MDELFLDFLNRAIAAGWLVLAVVVLRPLLHRAPKDYRMFLWGLVFLRLLLPAELIPESPASLVPSAEILPHEALYAAQPAIHSGVPVINAAVNPVLQQSLAPNPGDSVNPLQVWTAVGSTVWLIGAGVLLLYMIVSTLLLRRRVAAARPMRDNIWLCAGLSTPFVLGFFRPQIYLPLGMDEERMALVLAHEQGHIARHDHWLKPLAFLLLAAYWFHPLLWLAYVLFCRDMELACDEYVLRTLGQAVKKPYARALVDGSTDERISACPVAFGEGSVKARVKNVLRFRPIPRWLLLVLIFLLGLTANLFFTNPSRTELRPEADEIERIEIGNGTNGKLITVTDREQIEQLVSMTRSLELRRRGRWDGAPGFWYIVDFEPSSEGFTFAGATTLIIDGYCYEIVGDSQLFTTITSLFEQQDTDLQISAPAPASAETEETAGVNGEEYVIAATLPPRVEPTSDIEPKHGASLYSLRQQLDGHLIAESFFHLAWENKTDYAVAVAKNGSTVSGYARFSKDGELLEENGLRTIPDFDREDWVGRPYNEFTAQFGACHVDIGSGLSIPTYISGAGKIYSLTVDSNMILWIGVLDLTAPEQEKTFIYVPESGWETCTVRVINYSIGTEFFVLHADGTYCIYGTTAICSLSAFNNGTCPVEVIRSGELAAEELEFLKEDVPIIYKDGEMLPITEPKTGSAFCEVEVCISVDGSEEASFYKNYDKWAGYPQLSYDMLLQLVIRLDPQSAFLPG